MRLISDEAISIWRKESEDGELADALLERLRSAEDALRFYQHEANWIIPAGVGDYSDYLSAMCPVQDDGGKKARQHFEKVEGSDE